MMSKDELFYSQLKELTQLYNQKEYQKALKESKILRIKEQNNVDVFIALCYLHLKDVNEASFYIDRVLEDDPYHSLALLAAAYRDLYQGKLVTAIYIYTRLINFKKHLSQVKKILKIIKDKERASNIHIEKKSSFFIPEKLSMSYWEIKKPPIELPSIPLEWIPKLFTRSLFNFILTVLFLLLLGGGFFYAYEHSLSSVFSSRWAHLVNKKDVLDAEDKKSNITEKESLQMSEIENLSLVIDPNLDISNRDELFKTFSEIKQNIEKGKVNEAIILCNEVTLGESDESIKKQFRQLISYVPPITRLSSFEMTPMLSEVISDNKYLETYIIIKGILKSDDNPSRVRLSMLDDPKVKSVSVKVDKEILKDLSLNQNYTILVRYDGFDERTKEINLVGIDFKKQ